MLTYMVCRDCEKPPPNNPDASFISLPPRALHCLSVPGNYAYVSGVYDYAACVERYGGYTL
jgi:hypothetical protein